MPEKPWHESNTFWADVKPVLFTKERLSAAANEVDCVIELASIAKTDKILDLNCGIGRHTLEFASRGFSVTGVDATEEYLRDARERARTKNARVEFVKDDNRRFCRKGAYDVAISLFTSFGYNEDIEEDRIVAANVFNSLRPGGRFVIDLMGKEILSRIFTPRSWQEIEGGYVLEERHVSKDLGWMENRWIIIQNGRQKEYLITHRIYSLPELRELLESVGFSTVHAYDGMSGEAYDNRAKRLGIVAIKS